MVLFLILLAACFAAYWPALGGQFLWNDHDYVTAPALQSWHGLWQIWTRLGATEQYYPALHTAFWIEHRLWADAPLGYHLLNVGLHACSSYLVVVIARRLELPGAVWAGLIFALHPVCVESVAWISEEKNTLSTAWALLAALAYLRFHRTGKTRLYLGATALFALALLTKSVTATLPVVLLIVLWWKRGSLDVLRDFVPLVPWCFFGAAAGLVTGWVEWRYIGAGGAEFALSPVQRLLIAGHAFWHYLAQFVWPAHLIFFYPRWHVDAAAAVPYAYPLAALALIAVLWGLRCWSALASVLAFAALLVPVLGFLNVYAFVFSYVADHWQYLACIPAAIAAAAVGSRLVGRWGVLPWVIILGVLSFRQSRVYRSDRVLYEAVLARNPESPVAHHNLGVVLEAQGQPQEALAHYDQAVRAQPVFPDVYNDWGIALADLGRTADAVVRYQQALRQRPAFPQALNNLGSALLSLGRTAEAESRLREALRLTPDFPSALNNLGLALAQAGRLPEAVECYRRALALQPRFADAHNNLGVVLADQGHAQEARGEYEAALRLNPRMVEARSNLGNVLLSQGAANEAITQYRAALALDARYVQAHFNLGVALSQLGRNPEAAAQFREALRLDPDLIQARRQLQRLGDSP